MGDPPGQVRVIRRGQVAALVSEVSLPARLGSPEDLRAHKQILDATAAELPVLPLRFGAVLASEDAVAADLLAAHQDQFAAALDELHGCAELVVTAVTATREQDTRVPGTGHGRALCG